MTNIDLIFPILTEFWLCKKCIDFTITFVKVQFRAKILKLNFGNIAHYFVIFEVLYCHTGQEIKVTFWRTKFLRIVGNLLD